MAASSDSSKRPLPLLKVVRPKRLYEQIAEQIGALIQNEHLEPGDRLPGERELAERLGVSRPSVREALVALETSGLIEVRVGDGTVVRSRPAIGPVFPFAVRDDLGPGPFEQFQARQVIEPACAALAAQAATSGQIEALEAILARIDGALKQGHSPVDEHAPFHTLLAEASQNSILAGTVRELWRLRQLEMWDTLRKRVENVESWKTGLGFRGRLVEHLKRHDSAGAEDEMKKHLARVGRMYFDLK